MVAYAVNLVDLTSLEARNDWGLCLLLEPILDRSHAVQMDIRRFDEMGVLLRCIEERASAIIKIIRKRYPKYRLRCYRSQTGTGGWKRI